MRKKVCTNFLEKIGQPDPYFGVLLHPEYRSDRLDEKAKEKFYVSDKTHIDNVFQFFKNVWPNYQFISICVKKYQPKT